MKSLNRLLHRKPPDAPVVNGALGSHILFSDEFAAAVAGCPLVYVDAGARGGAQGPWKMINDDRLIIIAFEPDKDAPIPEIGSRQIVIRKALWSDSRGIKFHLAKEASTSSIYPPNISVLDRFLSPHGEPRQTLQTVDIESTSLDEALRANSLAADFIKIDTHSSEFEILLGAKCALQQSVFGVLVETWSTEAHKGQKLTGDILCLMRDYGFELFDFNLAAAWHRRGGRSIGKRQVIGLDLLFFREPSLIRERLANPIAAAKAAAITELYGFSDLAIEILHKSIGSNADLRLQTMLAIAKNGTKEPASLHE